MLITKSLTYLGVVVEALVLFVLVLFGFIRLIRTFLFSLFSGHALSFAHFPHFSNVVHREAAKNVTVSFKEGVVVEEVDQCLAVLDVLGLQVDDAHELVGWVLVVCNCAEVSDHIERQFSSGARNSDAFQFQHVLHDFQLLVGYVRLFLCDLKV